MARQPIEKDGISAARQVAGMAAPFGLRCETSFDLAMIGYLAAPTPPSHPCKVQITLGIGHAYTRFILSSTHHHVEIIGPGIAMGDVHPDVVAVTRCWTPKTHMRSADHFNSRNYPTLKRGQGVGVVVIPCLQYYLKLKLSDSGTIEPHGLLRYSARAEIENLLNHDLGLGYEVLVFKQGRGEVWDEHYICEAWDRRDAQASVVFTLGGSPTLPSYMPPAVAHLL